MKLLVLIALMSASLAEDLPQRNSVKRSYVCPPEFIRQGQRCYYFSRDAETWQDALFRCRDMHSNIAVIKNAYQDKLIRSFLSNKQLNPTQRWLGGVYDWIKMSWKWAASGKPLSYNGFSESYNVTDKDSLRWQCIIMDPSLKYRWSSRSCLEKKHFICHTRMKIVTNKAKKKLQRQYKTDKYNKLNEILVPTIPIHENSTVSLKSNTPIVYQFEINQHLNDQAMFAYTPRIVKNKVKLRKRKARKTLKVPLSNGTIVEVPKRKKSGSKRRKYKNESGRANKDDSGRVTGMKNIRWRTYKKEQSFDSLYPNPVVEEYNYVKES